MACAPINNAKTLPLTSWDMMALLISPLGFLFSIFVIEAMQQARGNLRWDVSTRNHQNVEP